MEPFRYRAVLLVGPTGSGKTPLGDHCQRNGLWGLRCHHFDFGHHLRDVSSRPERYASLSPKDRAVVMASLNTGALLENENFHIAEHCLNFFIRKNSIGPQDLILLNGLPRHPGQACGIDPVVNVLAVVYLECHPEDVRKRIFLNTGGDRSGRIDDSNQDIYRKLNLFYERTHPLMTFYRDRNIPIFAYSVNALTGPSQIIRWLEEKIDEVNAH